MPFDITNKVALITGGAQGIGLECAKELLRNKAKGIVIADVDTAKGEEASEQLNEHFGPGKVDFIHTDVSSFDKFASAFKFAVERFGHIDILVNNAGAVNELEWEKTIRVNVNGCVNGIILAMETYLKDFKSSEEAVIVNTASESACEVYPELPVYSSTKLAVLGITRTWGHPVHFERTKIKVMAVCPGPTRTNIGPTVKWRYFEEDGQEMRSKPDQKMIVQSAEHVGKEMVNIMKEGKGGSIWIVEESLPRYEYVFPDKVTFKPSS